MEISRGRILTTHAGSLPRPDDLTRMLYDVADGTPVDEAALQRRTREAVAEVVAKQRQVGIDVISDGEMGKVGFSNYVLQRFTGFEERAQFMAADVGDVPEIAPVVFGAEYSQHLRLPVLRGPIVPRDPEFVSREIETFKAALGDGDPDGAFIPAVSPGQVTFNFPNKHYRSHQEYLEAAAKAMAPEYARSSTPASTCRSIRPTRRWPSTAGSRAQTSRTPWSTWRPGSRC